MKHGKSILAGWAGMIVAAVVAAILGARPKKVYAPGPADAVSDGEGTDANR